MSAAAPAELLAKVVEELRGAPLGKLLSTNPKSSPSLNMGIVLRAAKQELRGSDIRFPASVTPSGLVAGDAESM